MTVPVVPRGLRSLIPGPGPEGIADDAGRPATGPAEAAALPDGAPPVAARARSMLDGLAPVPVPRAVAEASAEVLCALAASAPAELAQVARELAGRLRVAARTA
ncbi:hypothetical protein [Embleya hyalina]|uniref:Uncharacterized protein n=1 Tax=Embleya hyalina TaxID=516124 RepID=A0A401YH37_9ACTN|nr:hypothetical protein [Embleya hyalina]GCD93936.1 hypothetical protein EHYA_01591 [Embleya hyalina]